MADLSSVTLPIWREDSPAPACVFGLDEDRAVLQIDKSIVDYFTPSLIIGAVYLGDGLAVLDQSVFCHRQPSYRAAAQPIKAPTIRSVTTTSICGHIGVSGWFSATTMSREYWDKYNT